MAVTLTPPLDSEHVLALRAGDEVLITGIMYTARDAAHRRMAELLAAGEPLPVDLEGQILYYVGPTPPQPGMAAGSAGPTTSSRMDAYTPQLLAATGLKAVMGKGDRSSQVQEALAVNKSVYLAAVGGAGALLAQRIQSAEIVAWPELGTEAIHRFQVKRFPAIVAIDAHGGNIYREGQQGYRR